MSLEKKDIHVSDTAFVTCGFRRLNEHLSHDIYAKLWRNEKAELLLKNYTQEVSTEEIDTHCIRNRYFLEYLKDLITEEKIEVLINFGAGFSMYPYLLDGSLEHIEIDKPEIVNYKAEITKKWISKGILPERTIEYISVNFSTEFKAHLYASIQKIAKNRKCFILIEGVLYFLNKNETESIFELFNSIQNQGDYIGSVSYTEDVINTLAYKRLIDFSNKGMDDASVDGFQYIENSFYNNLPNYSLLDHQDYYSCSKRFGHIPKNDQTDILNEHFYVLQKQ